MLFTLQLYSQDNQNTPEYILNMKEIAQKGNSDVQYNLGLIYSNGEDVEKDLKKQYIGLRNQHRLKHVLAEYKLGYIYDNGLGVQKDLKKLMNIILVLGKKVMLMHNII